jgi:hypothetical protein
MKRRILSDRLRQRARRVSRSRSVSPGDGLAVRYGRGSPAHKSATRQRRFYSGGTPE